MNQIVAEEVELKKDSVAIEQTMQGLTMTAVPKVSQATTPAVAPITQTQSTLKNQNGGNTNKGTSNCQTPSSNHAPYNNSPSGYGTSRKKRPPQCKLCESGHDTGNCDKYLTPEDKRSRLDDLDRCKKCSWEIKGKTHYCDPRANCKYCRTWGHRTWLCITKPPQK